MISGRTGASFPLRMGIGAFSALGEGQESEGASCKTRGRRRLGALRQMFAPNPRRSFAQTLFLGAVVAGTMLVGAVILYGAASRRPGLSRTLAQRFSVRPSSCAITTGSNSPTSISKKNQGDDQRPSCCHTRRHANFPESPLACCLAQNAHRS